MPPRGRVGATKFAAGLTKLRRDRAVRASGDVRLGARRATSNHRSMNELHVGRTGEDHTVAQPLRLSVFVGRQVAAQINRMRPRRTAPRRRGVVSREDSHMSQLVAFAKTFARNEDGQDLLEYALLVALIALIAIGAVGLAGTSVKTIFTNISSQLNGTAS
ncbi:MAG: Flp family type IVb pilin [Acidobacteriota bacterium]